MAKLAAAIHRLNINVIVPVDMEHVTGAQQITIVSSFLRSRDGESLVNMLCSGRNRSADFITKERPRHFLPGSFFGPSVPVRGGPARS